MTTKVVRLSERVLGIIYREGKFPENEATCLERLLDELYLLRKSPTEEEEDMKLPVAIRRNQWDGFNLGKHGIPIGQYFLKPVLRVLGDGVNRPLKILVRDTLEAIKAPAHWLDYLTRGGSRASVVSKIEYAQTHLDRAGLTTQGRADVQGWHIITQAGKQLLHNLPERLTTDYLYENYPSYRTWWDESKKQR